MSAIGRPKWSLTAILAFAACKAEFARAGKLTLVYQVTVRREQSHRLPREYPMELHVDWLRLIRFLTQYVAPGLVTIVLIAEITDGFGGALVLPTVAIAYNYFILIVFSLLTTIMIGIFGWIVFLWDIDRLFFKLENKIDSQIVVMETKSGESGQDGTLLGRAKEMLNNVVRADREKPPRSSCAAHRTRLTRNSTGQRFGRYRVAPDLQVFCAGDQSAPLSPPRVAVPLAAWRALRPHRHMLLHQHPGVVARERVRIQPGRCLVDESRSLSAGFDASRSAVRFHGAHASISLAANDQSERHGVRLLHIDVSHVRRRLRHVLAVQGAPLRAAAMESAAAIAGPAKTFPSAKEGISAVEVAIAEGERSLKWWRPRLETKQKG